MLINHPVPINEKLTIMEISLSRVSGCLEIKAFFRGFVAAPKLATLKKEK